MYVVKWLSGDSKGYDDHIPAAWIKADGSSPVCNHWIVGPRGWLRVARCTVIASNEHIIFDYEGQHEFWNVKQGIIVGKMKFVFRTKARRGIPTVMWKDKGKLKGYASGYGEVEFRNDFEGNQLNHREGDRRLSSHLERERHAFRTAKLYEQLSKRGELRCEVCKVNLMAQYGAAGLAAIEVHHRLPLNRGRRNTNLKDLAVLCADCHRAIHFIDPMPSVENFAKTYDRQLAHN